VAKTIMMATIEEADLVTGEVVEIAEIEEVATGEVAEEEDNSIINNLYFR
jgi:hypothetical protein